jgi:hypothetical protein
MCDYILDNVRPAGDELVTTHFLPSIGHGFDAVSEPTVCGNDPEDVSGMPIPKLHSKGHMGVDAVQVRGQSGSGQ